MTRCLAFVTAAALLAGCAAKQSTKMTPPMPMPPTAEQMETIRGDFKTAFPQARVGVVSAVDDASKFALVNDMDTAGLKVGDFVSFLDSQQDVIANGKIALLDGGVTVMFDAGKRAPKVGDAAVKF